MMDGMAVRIVDAEALVVGPEETLVVKMPEAAGEFIETLSAVLRDRIGERFVVICADGLELAKVTR